VEIFHRDMEFTCGDIKILGRYMKIFYGYIEILLRDMELSCEI